MAETGSASASGSGHNHIHSPTPAPVSSSSRIRFPPDDSAARSPLSSGESSHKPLPLGFRSSPVRRSSPLASHATSSFNGRRRGQPVDVAKGLLVEPPSPRTRKTPSANIGPAVYSSSMEGNSSSPSNLRAEVDVFSDEYDLSHQDPQILQDVQRALKFKARREARIKSGSLSSPDKALTSPSLAASPTSSNTTSASRTPFPALTSSPLSLNADTSLTSDIDFSPSTNSPAKIIDPLHPVPSSIDDGATLDWTGSGSEEERQERRWTLSISKRKGKDKAPSLSSSTLEKQTAIYAAKLDHIRTVASPRTVRKAAITIEQLGRRYSLLYNSPGSDRFNLAKVVRWFDGLEALVKSTLETAEPFTWLKHLENHRTKTDRSPWHLSALIMEEFLNSQAPHDFMATIPENFNSHRLFPSVTHSRPALPRFPFSASPSSQFSLSRRLSLDGHVTFEPLAESTRNSVDRASRKSGESAYSSLFSASSNHQPAPTSIISPASSRIHLPALRQNPPGSSAASSIRNSISERSGDDDGKGVSAAPKRPSRSDVDGENIQIVIPQHSFNPVALGFEGSGSLKNSPAGETSDGEKPQAAGRLPVRARPVPSVFERPRVRISVPSDDAIAERKRQRDTDEEQVNQEYELKIQLLQETTAQNVRIRQFLHRITAEVREYDVAQSKLATLLDEPYQHIPQDVLDAFAHDPAAVTGATRKFRGWRAVEDIHNRLVRQREVFRKFLSAAPEFGRFPASDSVLDNPISALLSLLQRLETERQKITSSAKEVSQVLKNVETIHGDVKSEYNSALSHTSVVYPELSHLVALEESYKDQYQQIWEIGMDALTLFLDTVTPFWRNYGKTIGDDVQDFLIIPLYRNEFTGEPKRYAIQCFPKRSSRHWMGLLAFSMVSVMVTLLQTRAAVSSSAHCWLMWIPYPFIRRIALPFFWTGILIQWWAVVAEVAIVFAQLGVLGWWLGWSLRIFT